MIDEPDIAAAEVRPIPYAEARDLIAHEPNGRSHRATALAKLAKAPATFFKHALRDPGSEIEFKPKINECLRVFVAYGLDQMGEPQEAPEAALSVWSALHRPEFFLKDIFADSLPS
jgi:hypothetical protein